MSRRIKILLDQRSVEDSPRILDKISDSFPKDDLEIEIKRPIDEEKSISRDEILEIQANALAKDALQENNSSVISKEKEISQETPNKQNQQWVKELGKEGVKVSVQTILKGVIDSFIG